MKAGGYMLPAFFVAKKREKSLKPVDIYINDSIMISVREITKHTEGRTAMKKSFNERTMRRELETMPFDKAFETENGTELCHATGFEVCLGDPSNPADWWNEYEDSPGETHYGR